MADDIKQLQLKITALEDQLKALTGSRQAIDPEDMKVYQKVSQQLGLSFCISECAQCISCYHCYSCFHCISCVRCITECTCGPCITTSGVAAGRFGSLG